MSRQLLSFNPAFMRARGGASAVLSDLFADGQDGWYYSFADSSALLVEGEYGTWETVDGQATGFAMDQHNWGGLGKSAYLATQAETIANGGFDDTSAWLISGTGASISGGVATIPASNTGAIRQQITTEAGEWYLLEADVSGLSGQANGGIAVGTVQWGTTLASVNLEVDRTYHVAFLADDTDAWVMFRSLTAFGYTVDNVTVKKLNGAPARQTTNIARPAWSEEGAMLFNNAANAHLRPTALLGASGNTLSGYAVIPQTVPALSIIAGVKDASGGGFAVGVNTSGNIVGLVGTDTETTIVGTSDFRGEYIHFHLVEDGSTVTLAVNGAVEYTDGQNGAPSTTNAVWIGGLNNNGTFANPFGVVNPAVTQAILGIALVKEAVL